MKKKILFIIGIVASLSLIWIYTTAQPSINSVSDSPDPVEVPGYNNITADITNATQAYVEIYYPNATLMGNYSMTNIASTNTWYYNNTYAYPNPLGKYNYTVKAENATGWSSSSAHNFTLQDTTAPNSSVNSLPKYWYNANASVNATASDNYHVASVKLKYRYSPDNSTWSSWNDFSIDNAAPWQWNFNFSDGDGYYRFFTIATDDAGNNEPWPPVYDESAAYDSTPPTSSIDGMAYWYTSLPIVITASASDSLSGLNSVTLHYRYSSDNSSWGSWHVFATDSSSPWQWNFNAPDGDGYYEFYSIASDNASNEESKTTADENAGVDTTPPATSISASPSEGNHIKSSSSIVLSAIDATSGLNATYYRIWNGSWHPAPGTGVGKGNNFYIYAGAFYLSKEGTNYVEYYSDDKLGNEEAVNNKTYIVDDSPPSISNITASPPSQVPGGKVNVSCTVTDDTGVDGVYLEVRYPDGSFSNFTMHYKLCTTYYREEVYTIVGTYNFTIYAKDSLGNAIRSGIHHFVITSSNNPPDAPSKPSGPSSGKTGISYTYSTSTTDPDGDNIYYFFDWGDSSNSGWIGPYSSGGAGSASHSWTSAGTYYVKAKAKDINNAESGWSISLTVIITQANNPPTTTCFISPSSPNGKNGWYITSVNVSLTATDPEGDAIAYTKYRIDGGAWQTYNAPFIISSEGDHVLEFYSADDKGNVEIAKSTEIKIDKSVPYIIIQRPLPGYLYIFGRQLIPLATGNTVIIGRIVVRAIAYDSQSDIQNVSFYVNGMLEDIDTMYPYEWLWGGDIGYRYLSAVAYNKAGLNEQSPPIWVYIFSL